MQRDGGLNWGKKAGKRKCFCGRLSLIGMNVTLCPGSVKESHYIHRGSRGGSLFELCAFVLKFASNYHD